MKLSFLLLAQSLLLGIAAAGVKEILNFTQSAEAAAPNGSITFVCEAIGSADLRINGREVYGSNPSYGYIFNRALISETAHYLLSLTILAVPQRDNNTKISCYVPNATEGLIQDRRFIIADSPSKPQPVISYSQYAKSLRVSWSEPFTHPGFPITHYTLQITNTSDPSSRSPPLNMSHCLDYTDGVDTLPATCFELEYNVTAHNEIGPSAAGSVTGGFPINLSPVSLQWKALYQTDGTPHLEIRFESAYSCSFQEVNYTIHLEGSRGEMLPLTMESVYSTGNSSDRLYTIHTGLTSGASYTVVVEASSIAGTTVTRQEIVINEQHFHGTFSQQLSGYTGGFVVLTAVIVVLLILHIVFCFCYTRNKKQTFRSAFTETLGAPAAKSNTNPIYEGPLYESPADQPLRALLNSNPSTPSTPSTPLENTRYTFDSSPPLLPPSRKASCITTLSSTPSNSPSCEVSVSNEVENLEPEYAVMTLTVARPSPLSLSLPTQE